MLPDSDWIPVPGMQVAICLDGFIQFGGTSSLTITSFAMPSTTIKKGLLAVFMASLEFEIGACRGLRQGMLFKRGPTAFDAGVKTCPHELQIVFHLVCIGDALY